LGPDYARYVEDILASGRHLLMLINDILDLAKIEAGGLTLSLEPIEAADAVQEARSLVEPAAWKKRIKLETAVPENGLACKADEGKLRQVLLNLLSNAVKFSPDGAAIR